MGTCRGYKLMFIGKYETSYNFDKRKQKDESWRRAISEGMRRKNKSKEDEPSRGAKTASAVGSKAADLAGYGAGLVAGSKVWDVGNKIGQKGFRNVGTRVKRASRSLANKNKVTAKASRRLGKMLRKNRAGRVAGAIVGLAAADQATKAYGRGRHRAIEAVRKKKKEEEDK